MLLDQLAAYDRQRPDAPPAYYRHKQIVWAITLFPDGVVSIDMVRPPRVPRGEKQPTGIIRPVPHMHRTSAVTPYLLADSAEYVLGVPRQDPTTGEVTEKDAAKAATYHAAFSGLVSEWAAAVPDDPVASAVLEFLRKKYPLPDDITSGDLVALVHNGQWAHELNSATAFWADRVRALKGRKGRTGCCLVCGQERTLLDAFPDTIKKGSIPPGNDVNGTALVSVNTAAQGRASITSGLGSTPVCEPCGSSAVNALNSLLSDPAHRHKGPDFATVWWTREPVATGPLEPLDNPQPETVLRLMEAAHRPKAGKAALKHADTNQFHALTLGMNAGRTVVRDWIDVPLKDLEVRLGHWFDDHRTFDGWKGEDRFYSVWRLSLAGARWDKRTDKYVVATIPHGLEAALYTAALHGTPPPAWILPRLLQRIRADRHSDPARTALLRLALTRTHQSEESAMPGLNRDNTNPGYVCGRLFAALEAIQYTAGRTADRKVNATIRDKFFAVMMTSPGTILPNLRAGANNHLGQIRRRKPTIATALERRLGDLFGLLDNEIPTALTLPQQASFVLGYEHQRADDFAQARIYAEAQAVGKRLTDDEAATLALANDTETTTQDTDDTAA
ncbi:type I-C CRISPR-associated protein Cas8c/Csd1 [Streptomyces lunaelactis]|uniref:Type I-C CRISPR-associated protein Cas8c/Csd1 n=1 Tax=Streptomyces lunaelactis TaxID=1535768 RepID=A0A2R4SW77_9ACTN|nr:type I-C CRISPR-associated protein Cas8c/Csd1 [Streptomyces lunaelactis]AVZ71104.1 type I-C CRISPR-associated protein Cas8c/Csd1 [Streptomyces lunaelactis]NUK22776.1 type I-C CRISPR-associated protein Cas8c/Csd1 [Streptomyces lunaelactis]NUK85017.1 type I-C CRISPR-associated protein Cas8c/Csd1 [Streptomyces lunaelactis]